MASSSRITSRTRNRPRGPLARTNGDGTLEHVAATLDVIIGLEVHAQMNTKSKMFCRCDNDAFEKAPNTTVCPVCMGHPGSLPVPNAAAVEKAMRMSLALHCTVHPSSHFDRKHYFYPDLPSGFQISQYDFPLATKGYVDYGEEQRCLIHRLHIENDAGKLTHVGRNTLCDYNRAGTPLMEIVTEPDLKSAASARMFAEELRRILLAVDASDADMYKGMMRFDASISLKERGTEKLNPRSEIKNLNSFRALERALTFEEKRLRVLWDETDGPLPGDITVGWDDDAGETRILRNKESATDYRYFPEPDIPPLICTEEAIEMLRASLPKLPSERRRELRGMGLSEAECLTLQDTPALLERFEAIAAKTGNPRQASSLVLTQLMGFLNAKKKSVADAPSSSDLLALIDCVASGKIAPNAAKEVLEIMVETGEKPAAVIEERGLEQLQNTEEIDKLVEEALAANPQAVASYGSGKEAALDAIVGWIMKASKGKANPAHISESLKALLKKA